jgi:hypothetical protein
MCDIFKELEKIKKKLKNLFFYIRINLIQEIILYLKKRIVKFIIEIKSIYINIFVKIFQSKFYKILFGDIKWYHPIILDFIWHIFQFLIYFIIFCLILLIFIGLLYIIYFIILEIKKIILKKK